MKAELSTILVTGAEGQLGKEFQAIAATYPQFNFLFTSRTTLAIDNATAVENYFTSNKIDYCINCAAYTAVDKAETEREKAFLINATAAGDLAKICSSNGVKFIHISTDYVFDGNATQPMNEKYPVDPIGIYGASKLKGEELIMTNDPGSIIIRTSWVYSEHGNNFLKTMLRLMKERESINVVNDQLGCPTYAGDLAAVIMQMITSKDFINNNNGIFNYSNEGVISWYDFAIAIKKVAGSKCTVNPIPTYQYPTPAKRPHYSVLDTGKIKEILKIEIPGWKDSLIKCMKRLSAKEGSQ